MLTEPAVRNLAVSRGVRVNHMILSIVYIWEGMAIRLAVMPIASMKPPANSMSPIV